MENNVPNREKILIVQTTTESNQLYSPRQNSWSDIKDQKKHRLKLEFYFADDICILKSAKHFRAGGKRRLKFGNYILCSLFFSF